MNGYRWFDKFSWRYGGERKEAGAVAEGDPGTRSIVADRLPKALPRTQAIRESRRSASAFTCVLPHVKSVLCPRVGREPGRMVAPGGTCPALCSTLFQCCSERRPLASCCVAQGRLGGHRQEKGTSADGQMHRSKHRKQRGSPRPAAAGQSPGTLSAWGSAVFCTWPASPLLASLRTGKGQEQT